MNDNRYTRPDSEAFEKVVQVNRVSKKGKGGDKRSLSVLVVVGDKKGRVGVGLGKALDVQSAVAKATGYAKRHMITVPLKENRTIPHMLLIKKGAARVLLRPAPAGTGVIAGGAVRVVAEAAGIEDIVAKILGTKNRASNVYATLEGFRKLKPMRTESRVESQESSGLEEVLEKEAKKKTKQSEKKGKKS